MSINKHVEEHLKLAKSSFDYNIETDTFIPKVTPNGSVFSTTNSNILPSVQPVYTLTNKNLMRETFNLCSFKTIIDIGIDANAVCVTFDDYCMLEIRATVLDCILTEVDSLNALNGSRLIDICYETQNSLVSNRVGTLILYGQNMDSMVLKVDSSMPFVLFDLNLKGSNAVRK